MTAEPLPNKGKRSYPCNAQLLVTLRESKSLTQRELAQRVGYSERLIVKAESGRPIATETIEALAKVLSCGDQTVFFEDLVNDPVARAKEFLRAMYEERENVIDQVAHFLDKNVVFHFSGDPAVFPFAGTHRGLDEARLAFQTFFSILAPPPVHDHTLHYQYLGFGNSVVVWGESWIGPKGVRIEKPVSVTVRITFRKGKLTIFDDRFDTLEGAKMMPKGHTGNES